MLPVPITNTGAQGEYPKASEIIGAKELGKMTPYVRNKGCWKMLASKPAAEKRSSQLFNKNTALCQSVS